MKINERANTLSSLFYPKFWKELKALLQACEMISDSTKALDFEEIIWQSAPIWLAVQI